MNAMLMGFEEAVEKIGNALIALGGPAAYNAQLYPYPDLMVVDAGKPTITARWDGIGEDGEEADESIEVPKSLRYEIRIYHPLYAPADPSLNPDGLSGFVFAQKQVLKGTSAFYPALAKDRRLGNLVISTVVDGSITGDLVEPQTEESYYGHELLLTTTIRL